MNESDEERQTDKNESDRVNMEDESYKFERSHKLGLESSQKRFLGQMDGPFSEDNREDLEFDDIQSPGQQASSDRQNTSDTPKSRVLSIHDMDFDSQKSNNKLKNQLKNKKMVKVKGEDDTDGQPLYLSDDFVDQQIYVYVENTKSNARCVKIQSIILMIFPFLYLVYQLYLIITIQRQTVLISESFDSEGYQINMEVSYPLYILSILFGIISNVLTFYIGLANYRLIDSSQVILVKIQRRVSKLRKSEFMQERTTEQYSRNMITIFGIALLVVIQIGLNFISIQKAQSDYVQEHKKIHKTQGEVIGINERQALEILRQSYQYSYLGMAVILALYMGCYIYQFGKFKRYQMLAENTVLGSGSFKYK
ncbi:UNKNOWN [Stylonychia lemnae]|uniref:Transmembrane protein n=1 Tax=Stylonychia lemnae TaxID=5949 RepID=A0A078BBH5_STYLE|nr:UNKNOWN [Stylonychia lemnae]|eukprot:CDW91566.1 UNKNOWN [Stylonychia lemnae]